MKMREDERDELLSPRPGEGLPCDLPDEDRRGGFASLAAALGPRTRGRALVAGIALVAVAAVAVLVAVNVLRGPQAGPLAKAAGEGGVGVVSTALAQGTEAHARAVRNEGPVSGVVCIDAGHGGGADLTLTPIGPGSSEMQYVEPGGTSGVATGRDEAEVTLEIAKLLQAKLEDAGIEVVMVREDNETVMSSEQRAAVANGSGADIFLRLHCDGSEDPSVNGFSTLVPAHNEWTADIVDESARAAQIMHPIIVAETGARDAGIIERSDLAGFNFCDVPSVLFEMGFMSNPDEDAKLSDPAYQDTLAQAICDATIAYLKAVSG